jgi:hypothetical protein
MMKRIRGRTLREREMGRIEEIKLFYFYSIQKPDQKMIQDDLR